IQENVLATGQFRMKPGADFEESANATVDVDSAGGRFGDAVQDFQQGALARTVASNDAKHFTSVDVERYIFQSPECFVRGFSIAAKPVDQTPWQSHELVVQCFVARPTTALMRNPERLAQVLNGKGDVWHWLLRLNYVGKVALSAAKEKGAGKQRKDRHSDRDPKHCC